MLQIAYLGSVKQHFKDLKMLTVYGQYIINSILHYQIFVQKSNIDSQINSYSTIDRAEIISTHQNLQFFTKKLTHLEAKFLKNIPTA